MSIHRLIILSAAVLAVSASSTYAGPCSRCRPACAAGLSLPQSVGAMMHRQPTRGSVAAAEERLASMARCRSARLRIPPARRRNDGSPTAAALKRSPPAATAAPQQEAARTVGQGAAKPEASTPTQQVACTIHAAPDDYSQGVRPWK